jgi:hypothetical protein
MADDQEDAPPGGELPEGSSNSPTGGFDWSNLGEILGRVFRGVAFDHVLSRLLAIAVQAEQVVSDVVAIQLGRDEKSIEILGSEILGHVPQDKKLGLLEDMISARGWTTDFPEVVPILLRLHKLRNQLAHSYEAGDRSARRDDGVYHRRTYRRGRETEFQIDTDEILALTEAAEKILSEDLVEIARRSLP